jgi:hypothetical protein
VKAADILTCTVHILIMFMMERTRNSRYCLVFIENTEIYCKANHTTGNCQKLVLPHAVCISSHRVDCILVTMGWYILRLRTERTFCRYFKWPLADSRQEVVRGWKLLVVRRTCREISASPRSSIEFLEWHIARKWNMEFRWEHCQGN